MSRSPDLVGYYELGMHISPLPAALQQLGGRSFSFYPPIRNTDHNRWIYRRATWSEIVVVNARSGEEVCVPRAFVGEVSIADNPAVVVSLKRELEWKDGALRTYHCPVIELPVAVNQHGYVTPHPEYPAPVISIRLEPPPASHKGRKIGVGLMLSALACWIGVSIERQGQSHRRDDDLRLSRSYLQLNGNDDYSSVVRKLGAPSAERFLKGARILDYPRRQFSVVLAGAPADPRYMGALDPLGRVLNAAPAQDAASASRYLRSLARN
jgi:hypothetical protein